MRTTISIADASPPLPSSPPSQNRMEHTPASRNCVVPAFGAHATLNVSTMAKSFTRPTRKNTDVWLIGPRSNELSERKLPSKREVMAYYFHFHLNEKMTVRGSATMTANSVLEIWNKARIPTRLKKHVIGAVEKIFEEWKKLKKNRNNKTKRSGVHVEKETAFKLGLDTLFDIAHADALVRIKIPEDKEFLLSQREKGRPGKMAGIDKSLEKKEAKARDREEKKKERIRKAEEDKLLLASKVVLQTVSSESESTHSSESTDGVISDEPLAKRSKNDSGRTNECRKNILTPELSAMLDRTKLSDRQATAVLMAAGASLGHNMDNYTLSRSSILRSRMKHREDLSNEICSNFSFDGPLVVHWDAKLLEDITGKKMVDRLSITVTGDGVEQLLCIPKLSQGTGRAMGTAVVGALDQWKLRTKVKAMCFDTTATNTGRKNGACVFVEQQLDKDLLYLACRHHVFELLLEAACGVTLSPSASPEILIFKRFQMHWSSIDQQKYDNAADDEFVELAVAGIRNDVIAFALDLLSIDKQPREDYRELLEITITFLGVVPPRGIHFRRPGGIHRARWMTKAIYAIKIWMFKKQFILTKTEESGIRDLVLFVVTFYIKAWFQAPLPARAPFHDLNLMKRLKNCASTETAIGKCAKVAMKKLSGHLWYISEELVGLAFFDDNVDLDTKRKMVYALNDEGAEDIQKRVTIDEKVVLSKRLEHFVSQNTLRFFTILDLDCSFLKQDPETWPTNEAYLQAKRCVRSLKVVNDVAERGIALISNYNELHTKNEEQKQFILQIVSEHRKKFKTFNKTSLMSTKCQTYKL